MTDNRIVKITFPKCESCVYAQAFDAKDMAECYGLPPRPFMLGASQGPLGPVINMEVFSPKITKQRPACSIYKPRQDFETAGRS